jgi:DNA primase
MDHVSFSEAVELLAGRLGYELHYEDGGQASDHGNRARILSANQAAADFYVASLGSEDAEPGRRFLGERGFDQGAAERFGIGFAPRHGALGKHLKTLGYSEEELVVAGLLGRGERGDVYDRFRGRLVWPIRDTTGQTVGFGARKLLDDDQGPKYLNTPETPVYHKSQVLYGLDLAKKDISRGKQVVVVEGYTDVMACHLAGVTTAVATCGTSFGVDHIKMIRRVMGDVAGDVRSTGEVIFTFDPDAAGQKAASRAFDEEQRFSAQTFVAVAPDGLDPCDLRLHRGDDAVRRLVTTRKPMFEFMIRRVLDAHNLATVEGRVAALRATAPVVAGIRDEALEVGYVRQTAQWLGMELDEVRRAVASARSSSSAETKGDAVELDSSLSLMQLPTDPTTRLERDALMAMLQYPADVGLDFIQRAAAVTFTDNTLAVVGDAIATSAQHWEEPDWLARVSDEVPLPFATLVKQLGVAPIPERPELIGAYCRDVVAGLIDRDLLRQKKELLGSLQRTDATAQAEAYAQVQRDLVRVEGERRALRAG